MQIIFFIWERDESITLILPSLINSQRKESRTDLTAGNLSRGILISLESRSFKTCIFYTQYIYVFLLIYSVSFYYSASKSSFINNLDIIVAQHFNDARNSEYNTLQHTYKQVLMLDQVGVKNGNELQI